MFLTFFFFFNDTATTEIYTLSLHDALPISLTGLAGCADLVFSGAMLAVYVDGCYWHACPEHFRQPVTKVDRKSTRLNSSHANISYAVFCLKKKKIKMLNRFTQLKQILLLVS